MDGRGISRLVTQIFKQATATFSAANQRDIAQNVIALRNTVDTVRFSDLSLPEELLSKSFWDSRPDKAPCTYVELYEGPTFSISVFVMAENYQMPMHDHPQMTGILKCIAGNLRVESYSLDTGKETALDMLERLYALNPLQQQPAKKYIQCKKEPPIDMDETSPAAVLSPTQSNIHQITALGGPVAFFDILAPPYTTTIEARPMLKRKCTFFRVAEDFRSSLDVGEVVLEKIPQPLNYYCDNVEWNTE